MKFEILGCVGIPFLCRCPEKRHFREVSLKTTLVIAYITLK